MSCIQVYIAIKDFYFNEVICVTIRYFFKNLQNPTYLSCRQTKFEEVPTISILDVSSWNFWIMWGKVLVLQGYKKIQSMPKNKNYVDLSNLRKLKLFWNPETKKIKN